MSLCCWCHSLQVLARFFGLDVLIFGSSFVMLPFFLQETRPPVFSPCFFWLEVARIGSNQPFLRQQDFIDFSPAVVDFQFQLLSLYAKHHQDVPGNLQLVSDRTDTFFSGSGESLCECREDCKKKISGVVY